MNPLLMGEKDDRIQDSVNDSIQLQMVCEFCKEYVKYVRNRTAMKELWCKRIIQLI